MMFLKLNPMRFNTILLLALSGMTAATGPAAAQARTPIPVATSPRSVTELRGDLGSIIGAATRGGRWGVMVVSLTRGDTLYSLNAGGQFMPASTMKLFVGALALDRFGPEHRFETTVLRTSALSADGTVNGDLILRGAGDPALAARSFRGNPSAAMDLLASLVAGAGVRRVRGDIIGDASAFESRLIPEGWQSRYLQAGYAARVSALSLNENLIWIAVSPGQTGNAAAVALEPATQGLRITNNVRTRAGTASNVIVRRLPDGSMEARGWIGARSPTRRYLMVVENPASFATGAFAEALLKQGVILEGGVRLGSTPATAQRVTSLPSPPLEQLVAVMNRESINHYAELLFRNAARDASRGAPGSAETGNAALRSFMTGDVGAAPDAVEAKDGSGLSMLNRATPRGLVQLLAHAHTEPWSSAFHASLPVAGESELLRTRMRGTQAHGNLHAKTGTTNEVISLAGYTTAVNGEVIAFSFIYNGPDRWRARQAIDVMGATMSAFGRQQPTAS